LKRDHWSGKTQNQGAASGVPTQNIHLNSCRVSGIRQESIGLTSSADLPFAVTLKTQQRQ
jgi:hypothetical protein